MLTAPDPDTTTVTTTTVQSVVTPLRPRDTRPAAKRAWDRHKHWVIALAVVFPVSIPFLLAALPVVEVLLLVGLLATVVKLTATAQWKTLRHIAFGLTWAVTGYWVARLGVHLGLLTLRQFQAHVTATTDARPNGNLANLWADVPVIAWYLASGAVFLGFLPRTLNALFRPHRTNFPPSVILFAMALVGVYAGTVS